LNGVAGRSDFEVPSSSSVGGRFRLWAKAHPIPVRITCDPASFFGERFLDDVATMRIDVHLNQSTIRHNHLNFVTPNALLALELHPNDAALNGLACLGAPCPESWALSRWAGKTTRRLVMSAQ
jgi:hypothetical protein